MTTTLDLLHGVRDLKDQRLRALHRAVLVGILMCWNQKIGGYDPSTQQIADAMGLGRSSVHRAITELREWGLLKVTFRGAHRSSVYELVLPIRDLSQRDLSQQEVLAREVPPLAARGDTSRSERLDLSQRDPLRISSEDLLLRISPEDPPPTTAPKGARTRTPRARSAGQRLAEDWKVSGDLYAWAEAKGIRRREVERVAESFRDYWLSSSRPNALKVDWNAAFRIWMRNAIQRGEITPMAPTKPAPPEPTPEQRELVQSQRLITEAAVAAMEANAGGRPLLRMGTNAGGPSHRSRRNLNDFQP